MGAGRAEDQEGAAREERGQDAGGERAAEHAATVERRSVGGMRAHEGGAERFCWWCCCFRGASKP